jgi:dTDP-4-amino-4,6-dideoxygalactose transaminase
MSLMALGVGPGDAVFTTPFTFIATAEVVHLLGATPVFVDIDPATFNMDPAKLEKAIAAVQTNDPKLHPLPKNPKSIIPVDLFGLPADYERIEALAADNSLSVIEDGAQSFGASVNGKAACSFGDIAVTSFFPAKPLGGYGDGGMAFTDGDELAEAVRSIRLHGKGTHKYDNARIGVNGRLDTLHAAILLAKFEVFPEEMEFRQKVAQQYTDLLCRLSSVVCPLVPEGHISAWAQYSLVAESAEARAELQNRLKEEGIPTAVYYPKPLHLQTAFKSLGYQPGDFPISESISERIFSIPMHPYLTEEDQTQIAKALKAACICT